jgi:DNA-binding transcriptional ArsR family regulator
MDEQFTPAEELVIGDLETLKVLSDELRLSILEYLQDSGTVKSVADKLNRPPTKLYYHFNLLEKHGLIQMVNTRIVSGIVEKHYQASALRFRLARGLLSPTSKDFDEQIDTMFTGIFGSARDDLRESLVDGVVETGEDAPAHRSLLLNQSRSLMTVDEADKFYEQLGELLKTYGFTDIDRDSDRKDPNRQLYKITVALHPSSRGKKSS